MDREAWARYGVEGMCPSCESEEIRRAMACLDREDEAKARGEQYTCTCPHPPCTHRKDNDGQA